jgi:hypothetical protein
LTGDLSVLDAARNVETKLTFGQKVSVGPAGILGRPVWSSDGVKVAYFSEGKIFAKLASGAGEAIPLVEVHAIHTVGLVSRWKISPVYEITATHPL